MVEVEQRARVVDFLDDAGVATAVGRREVEQVARAIGGAELAVLREHRARHPLQQRRLRSPNAWPASRSNAADAPSARPSRHRSSGSASWPKPKVSVAGRSRTW
jgi:hypothetical protein